MKKQKHIKGFIRFILEKYSQDGQGLPEDDEIEIPDEENEEPQPKNRKKIKTLNEFEDEEDQDDEETIDDEVDDEIIDELLNEYKRLKRKYENNRIPDRRKR